MVKLTSADIDNLANQYPAETEFDRRSKNPLYPVDSEQMREQLRLIDQKISGGRLRRILSPDEVKLCIDNVCAQFGLKKKK